MQQEVELSEQRHAGDLKEKERLSRMMGHKVSIINPYATFFVCIISNDELLTIDVICHHRSQNTNY